MLEQHSLIKSVKVRTEGEDSQKGREELVQEFESAIIERQKSVQRVHHLKNVLEQLENSSPHLNDS